MKPSQFSKASPMGSVLQNSESETVANNIMTILSRTGDKWRNLTYDEYKKERQKDFNMYNGKKVEPVIWKMVRPTYSKAFKNDNDI